VLGFTNRHPEVRPEWTKNIRDKLEDWLEVHPVAKRDPVQLFTGGWSHQPDFVVAHTGETGSPFVFSP
jgi:hypothetical protein